MYSYRTIASQPFAVSEAQGLTVDSRLYSFGGFDSQKSCCTPTARSYVYDPVADDWTRIANLPFLAGNGSPGTGVTHAGVATDGTDIYLAGGYVSANGTTGQTFGTVEAYRYDVSADAYQRLPDLPARRASGTLAYLDGSLHFVSGTNAARTTEPTDHYILDLAGGATSWVTSDPLPAGRNHAAAVTLAGRMYVVGGQTGHDGASTTHADVWSWTQAEGWVAEVPLPLSRGHITSSTFVLDDRIVVAGGMPNHGTSTAQVHAYNPGSDSWTSLSSLPASRSSGVAGAVGDGDWLYSGGGTANGWRASPSS